VAVSCVGVGEAGPLPVKSSLGALALKSARSTAKSYLPVREESLQELLPRGLAFILAELVSQRAALGGMRHTASDQDQAAAHFTGTVADFEHDAVRDGGRDIQQLVSAMA
jgi:hypothetical protein